MSDISSLPPVSFSGIESGLDEQQIISAYLSIDEAPLTQLDDEQSNLGTQISDYQALQSQLATLQTAATAVSAPDAFASAVSSISSNSAVATATTGPGASEGSITFAVDQLATADSLISSGTVASTDDVVSDGDLLVAAGGSGLGIGSISGSGLTLGAHSVSVTQASAGATIVGSSALSTSTTIGASNDQLSVVIDGVSQVVTIANGTYSQSQLAAAVTTASGGTLTASVNSASQLVLATEEQGSDASLQIGSGSANAALGISAGGAVNGTDGVITVDGTANTISDIAANGGNLVTLNSGSGGTITALLNPGGLTLGSITAQNVSVGNGSLASVVAAINSANAGVTADAITVGTDEYALSLSSDSTGAANDVSVAPTAFSASSLGSLETSTTGQSAIVSLGGPGGYQIQSESNSVSGLLPGVTIDLQQTSSSPVTISVNPSGTAAASLVQTFVSAANAVLQTISTDTAYDEQTNTAGPLNGDDALLQLSQQVLSVVGNAIGSSSISDSGTTGEAAGLSVDASTGQINFDAGQFATDFQTDPSAIETMFTQSGAFAPASGSPAGADDVSLIYASDTSTPGTYAVDVSHSATQATDSGSAAFATPSTAVSSGETYTVTSAGRSASYGVSAGESLSSIVGGLNSAFAQAGLGLSAEVVASGSDYAIEVSSATYGSQASFSVTSSGSDELGLDGAAFTGSDVVGTINGVVAAGNGQVLSAPASDPTLAGLSLLVTTPGISTSTSLGNFTYTPGLAGGLGLLAAGAIATPNGEIPSKIAALQSSLTQLGDEITTENNYVVSQQQQLESEFNNLEATMATLKGEQSYLTDAFGASSASSGSLATGSTASSSSGTGDS